MDRPWKLQKKRRRRRSQGYSELTRRWGLCRECIQMAEFLHPDILVKVDATSRVKGGRRERLCFYLSRNGIPTLYPMIPEDCEDGHCEELVMAVEISLKQTSLRTEWISLFISQYWFQIKMSEAPPSIRDMLQYTYKWSRFLGRG